MMKDNGREKQNSAFFEFPTRTVGNLGWSHSKKYITIDDKLKQDFYIDMLNMVTRSKRWR